MRRDKAAELSSKYTDRPGTVGKLIRRLRTMRTEKPIEIDFGEYDRCELFGERPVSGYRTNGDSANRMG